MLVILLLFIIHKWASLVIRFVCFSDKTSLFSLQRMKRVRSLVRSLINWLWYSSRMPYQAFDDALFWSHTNILYESDQPYLPFVSHWLVVMSGDDAYFVFTLPFRSFVRWILFLLLLSLRLVKCRYAMLDKQNIRRWVIQISKGNEVSRNGKWKELKHWKRIRWTDATRNEHSVSHGLFITLAAFQWNLMNSLTTNIKRKIWQPTI